MGHIGEARQRIIGHGWRREDCGSDEEGALVRIREEDEPRRVARMDSLVSRVLAPTHPGEFCCADHGGREYDGVEGAGLCLIVHNHK